jgi:hypothetical protein
VSESVAGGGEEEEEDVDEPSFQALPSWMMRYSVGLSYGLIAVIVLLVALVVGLNVYQIVDDNI